MGDGSLRSSPSTSRCVSPQLGVIQSPILPKSTKIGGRAIIIAIRTFVLGILLFCRLHCCDVAHGYDFQVG